MTLKAVVESLDSVPEPLRDFYAEKDGKFALLIEGQEDTTALKRALESERKAAREAQKFAKPYEGLGLSADEIKAIVEEKRKAEDDRLRKEGDFQSILKQKETEWQSKHSSLEAELQAARQSEHRAVIGTSLMAALTKAGATDEGVDLLADRLSSRIRYEMEDGRRVIRILSADGEMPMAGSAKDGTATFDDLVKEAAKTYRSLFRDPAGSGGGKPPKGAGGAGAKTIAYAEFVKLSAKERAAFMANPGATITPD